MILCRNEKFFKMYKMYTPRRLIDVETTSCVYWAIITKMKLQKYEKHYIRRIKFEIKFIT